MATRSILIMKKDNGQVLATYVHSDGDDHLPILQNYYSTQKQIEELCKLGDLSVLGRTTGKSPDETSHDNEYCIAYHRDRGYKLEYAIYNSVEEAIADVNTKVIVYLYIWDGNTWSVKKRDFKKKIWK
ncbi:MAG: hypothetical protein FWG98_09590 [Candidatus Cloacimonetes bacterium]|nr:hypothetical protein [Candidatus Cloacimonadota bacterium]